MFLRRSREHYECTLKYVLSFWLVFRECTQTQICWMSMIKTLEHYPRFVQIGHHVV